MENIVEISQTAAELAEVTEKISIITSALDKSFDLDAPSGVSLMLYSSKSTEQIIREIEGYKVHATLAGKTVHMYTNKVILDEYAVELELSERSVQHIMEIQLKDYTDKSAHLKEKLDGYFKKS